MLGCSFCRVEENSRIIVVIVVAVIVVVIVVIIVVILTKINLISPTRILVFVIAHQRLTNTDLQPAAATREPPSR